MTIFEEEVILILRSIWGEYKKILQIILNKSRLEENIGKLIALLIA